MLATAAARDDDRLTPPVRRDLPGLVAPAFARHIREADEMQRLIEPQSFALAAAGVGIGFLVVGFLDGAGVFTLHGELTAILALPSLFGAYGVARAVVQRSYVG